MNALERPDIVSTSGLRLARYRGSQEYTLHCTVTQRRIGKAWRVSHDGRNYRTSVAFDGCPIYISVLPIPDAIDELISASQ